MAQPTPPSKTMSSRLLTMKFMQRAAASPPSSPGTPAAHPSAKRQRLSNGSYNSSPSSTSDAQALQAAIAAEEQKRLDALEREAASRGESKWYLSFQEPKRKVPAAAGPGWRVVEAGFGVLDSAGGTREEEDDVEEEEEGEGRRSRIATAQGRRSFGKFNRTVEKLQRPGDGPTDSDSSSGSEDEEDDEEDEEEEDDPTGANAMIAEARKEAAERVRAERKAKREAAKAEAEQLAAERRKKTVNLNRISSISGGRDKGDKKGWKSKR